MLIDRGCPEAVLALLKKREWHHIWKEDKGRVGREYYWSEKDVLHAERILAHNKRMTQQREEAMARKEARRIAHAAFIAAHQSKKTANVSSQSE